MGRGRALAGLLILFVVTNLALTVWFSDASTLVAVVAIVAFLVAARALGLTAAELGLSKQTWRRGARWAAVAIVAVSLVYVVMLAVDDLRDLLVDDRGPDTLAATMVEAFLVIPIRTVLLEELAFRGVLWAYLRREWSTRVATIGSSVAFGLWHITSASGFADGNEAAGDITGDLPNAGLLVVLGTVLVTAAAGVLLCELRRRSDSLLAPIGLHWAANGPGTIASYLAR